jgi:hypothetical protein
VLTSTGVSDYTDFNWNKLTDRKIFVRFTDQSGQVLSNRVAIPVKSDNNRRTSLIQQQKDPIISGGSALMDQEETAFGSSSQQSSLSYQTDGNAKVMAFSSQLMAADPFASNTVGVDPGLIPVASGAFI